MPDFETGESTSFDSLCEPRAAVDYDAPWVSSSAGRTYNILWLLAATGAGGLFLASLWLPVIHTEWKSTPGLFLLALGWFGVLQLHFAWFANPVFIVGWLALSFRRYHWSLLCGLAALPLGAQTFFLKTWYNDAFGAIPVTGLGAGYYCWLGSFLTLFVASAVLVPSMDPRRYA